MNDPGAYVVRSTRAAPSGHATYELVDRHLRLVHVTVPRNLGATEHLDLVLRAAVTGMRPPTKVIP